LLEVSGFKKEWITKVFVLLVMAVGEERLDNT
jgi:hypothetical protein